jgi:hypothetical protein
MSEFSTQVGQLQGKQVLGGKIICFFSKAHAEELAKRQANAAVAGAIIQRIDMEPDITIKRALILSLCEFDEEKLPSDAGKALQPKLQVIPGWSYGAERYVAAWWTCRARYRQIAAASSRATGSTELNRRPFSWCAPRHAHRLAANSVRRFAYFLRGRQQQREQCPEDGQHHDEFNERECCTDGAESHLRPPAQPV